MSAKKQVTREMILDTALRLLKERGFEAVNVKELAKELKCSTQPIYLSFTGMEELRRELNLLAVREFENIMKGYCKDGIIRLYECEYISFAQNESNLFCYLFMRANAFSEIKRTLLPIIEQSITELMEIYHISNEEADYLHDNLWMHAHGIASMIATRFCDWNMAKAGSMLDRCKDSFVSRYEV